MLIHDSIAFGGTAFNTCQGGTGSPVVLNLVSGATSNFFHNAVNHTWSISLNAGNHTLVYHILLDCGVVVPEAGSLQNISFVQSWADSAGAFVFKLNGSNQHIVPVAAPFINDITPQQFYGSYLDTTRIHFRYRNSGSADAAMQFRFNHTPLGNCPADTLIDLEFALGDTSNLLFSPLTPDTNQWISVLLRVDSTLTIRKTILTRGCVGPCNTQSAILRWKCSYTGSGFCDRCQNQYDSRQHALIQNPQDTLGISVNLITPDSFGAEFDISCMNTKTQWEYRIVNGKRNVPEAKIMLYYGSPIQFTWGAHDLTLIDTADIQISDYCTGCFSVSKLASADPVAAGDTLTYSIIICANNIAADSVILHELLPANFIMTLGLLLQTITLPAQGCDTVTVHGYFTLPGSCIDNINTALVITQAGDTLSADTCVTVMYPCWQPGINEIADSTFASSLGISGYSNTEVYIENRFYVDIDFTFTNCTVYVASGGQLIVMNDIMLTLDNTDVQGCTNMWNQILLRDPGSKITVMNQSKIRDAETGIYAMDRTEFYVHDSDISECITGIATDPDTTGNYRNIIGKVWGCRFGMWNSGSFKPDYAGQPPHGAIPRAGIELNNVAGITIGNYSAGKNQFNRMHAGIVGWGSDYRVVNSEFTLHSNDAAYPKEYAGTAVISKGDSFISKARLSFQPVSGAGLTVNGCTRGVYTLYSDATLSNIRMAGVSKGVYSTHTSASKTVTVNGCEIDAVKYGIHYVDNAGAKNMYATDNTIRMSTKGSIGVYVQEMTTASTAPYTVSANRITTVNGYGGIVCENLNTPQIQFNIIHLSHVSPQALMAGIELNGNIQAQVTCNYVQSNTLSAGDTTKIGIAVKISTNSNITCNTVDSTGWGIYFGGDCDVFNNLSGNTMTDCLTGLYLNSASRIGQQIHKGNRWINSLGGSTQAINQNFNNYLNSLIRYNPNSGIAYYPSNIIPPLWFDPDISGITFTGCGTQICNAAIAGEGGDEVSHLKSVACDSSISYDYLEENKNQAQQNLYNLLYEDSLLRLNDSVFTTFFVNRQPAAIGKLNEVSRQYSLSAVYDSIFKEQYAIADSLIKLKTDSVFCFDSLILAGSTLNLLPMRESLMDDINSMNATLRALLLQKQATAELEMESARNLNFTISPAEIPEANNKAMNEYLYLHYKYGSDSLLHYYNDMLSIAQQCPYAGGKAVYQARAMLSLLNDTIEYNDLAVCSQNGIYRQIISQDINQTSYIDFRLIPNPALQRVTVELNFRNDNNILFEIRNVLGAIIKKLDIDKGITSITLSIENFEEGIYFVRARKDNMTLGIKKLIIIK